MSLLDILLDDLSLLYYGKDCTSKIPPEVFNRAIRDQKVLSILIPVLKKHMTAYSKSATVIQSQKLKELSPYLKSEHRKDDAHIYED